AGWRAFTAWPPAECESSTFQLRGDGTLATGDGAPEASTDYDADPTVGAMAGLLDPLGVGVGYPLDQGLDDASSLTFTSAPLESPLEIAGTPALLASVEVLAGREPMMLSARLSDVSPHGRSTLICRGWANVWHRDGHEASAPPAPAERRELRVELGAIAYRLAAGHRLRLSLACADFPTMWPSTGGERIRVHHGGAAGSRLVLPVLRGESQPPRLPLPQPRGGIDRSPWDAGGEPEWTIERDLVGGTVSVALGGRSSLRLPDGARFDLDHRARAVAGPGRVAELDTTARIEIAYPDGTAVRVDTSGHHQRTTMRYAGSVVVDGETVFDGHWAAGS
ncbi:MAG TPA: CocE/NonD family hydrolase, partial [Acidimicrobiales bacterium]|nr:CocE/NonD family hydrolase [Acidimicrobiales bacterium]